MLSIFDISPITQLACMKIIISSEHSTTTMKITKIFINSDIFVIMASLFCLISYKGFLSYLLNNKCCVVNSFGICVLKNWMLLSIIKLSFLPWAWSSFHQTPQATFPIWPEENGISSIVVQHLDTWIYLMYIN